MSDEKQDINFYYKLSNEKARVFNHTKNNIETMVMTDVYKLKKRYYVFKGYECSDIGLKNYARDFFKWTKEIETDKHFKFIYTEYKSHEDVTMRFFEKLCKTKQSKIIHTNWQNHESIDAIEYKWIESCNNSSLRYCESGIYEDCNGYDYSLQFPTIMSYDRWRVPTKRGKEYTLKEVPTKSYKLGYYRVKITSDDKRFKKVFGFSEKHVYTDISLGWANECKTKYGYDINIEMIQEENNCYLYEDGNTSGHVIFGYWFEVLNGLRERYPKNKLIKNMASSLWGRICQHNKLTKTEQEAEDQNIDYVHNYNRNHDYYVFAETLNCKNEILYTLVNCKNPYKYALARMKPFLLSKSRDLIARKANKYIDDVIRIHTDNVTFNKEHDDICLETNIFKIVKEDKTTGKIHFVRADCYKHFTNEKYTTKSYKKYENNELDFEDDE